MADTTQANLSIREAAYQSLKMMGMDLLRQPERFLGCLLDLTDNESALMRLLMANCDGEFLAPFVSASEAGTADAMGIAYRQAAIILHEGRLVQEDAARNVSAQIAFAVAAASGIQPPEDVVREATQDARASLIVKGEEEAAGSPAMPMTDDGREVTVGIQDVTPAVVEDAAPETSTDGLQVDVREQDAEMPGDDGVTDEVPGVSATSAPASTTTPDPAQGGKKKVPVIAIAAVVAVLAVVGLVVALTSGGSGGQASTGTASQQAADVDYASLASSLDVKESEWKNKGGYHVLFLRVTNKADVPVNIRADFTYSYTSDSEDKSDEAWHIAPGETTFLQYSHEASSGDLIRYELVTSAPSGSKSLKQAGVKADVLHSSNDEGVAIQLTNGGDETVKVPYATLYGDNSSGDIMCHNANPDVTLEPGQSAEMDFDKFKPDDLTNLELYLYGYAL